MRRIVLPAVLAALATTLAVAPIGLAAGPTREIEVVSETFHDDFLTDECGVDVTTTASGTVIHQDFGGEGVEELHTVNVALVATAGDRTFRFRNVGTDIIQDAAGTLTLLIVGQVPFGWTGVLKIDLATGEFVLEPHWVDTERACKSLAG